MMENVGYVEMTGAKRGQEIMKMGANMELAPFLELTCKDKYEINYIFDCIINSIHFF